LFAEDIFGFFGKLPIHRRLVPKVIIPIHACRRSASTITPQPLRDLPQQDILI
jgi:hypothetical protein